VEVAKVLAKRVLSGLSGFWAKLTFVPICASKPSGVKESLGVAMMPALRMSRSMGPGSKEATKASTDDSEARSSCLTTTFLSTSSSGTE